MSTSLFTELVSCTHIQRCTPSEDHLPVGSSPTSPFQSQSLLDVPTTFHQSQSLLANPTTSPQPLSVEPSPILQPVNTQRERKPSPTRTPTLTKNKPWTLQETQVVRQYFRSNLRANRAPSKKEARLCRLQKPRILGQRTALQIVDKIKNMIKKKTKFFEDTAFIA